MKKEDKLCFVVYSEIVDNVLYILGDCKIEAESLLNENDQIL